MLLAVWGLLTALVLALAAWLVAPTGWRWPFVLLAVVAGLTGMAAGVPAWRSTPLFFVLIVVWGVLSGVIELVAGIRGRRMRPLAEGASARRIAAVEGSRDAILIGALSLLLAVAVVCVPSTYALNYSIAEAGTFTLTGITLAVGLFGAYAAIVAVFLGIAGLSPRPAIRPGERAANDISGAAPAAPAENEGSA